MTIARQPCVIAPELERPVTKAMEEEGSKSRPALNNSMIVLYTTIMERIGKHKLSLDTSNRCQHPVSRRFGCCAVGFVVYPEDEEDVRVCLGLCQESLVTVTTFGSGTSLMGKRSLISSEEPIEESAASNVIALDLTRLSKVLEVSPEDGEVRVQAGITRNELNKYLEPYGLFFPADPGANATVGGLIGTGADGPMATGYGRLNTLIVDVSVMQADGIVRRYGRNSIWKELFVGTKGRFGIVLEATLKVFMCPTNAESLLASFPVQSDALNAAHKLNTVLVDSGIRLVRCEYLDASCMSRLNESYQVQYPQGPSLLIELHGDATNLSLDVVREVCEEFHVQNFRVEEADEMWKNRYRVWAAIRPMLIGKLDMPVTKVNQTINQVRDLGAQHGLMVHTIAAPIMGMVQVLVQEQADYDVLRLLGFVRAVRDVLKGVSCYFANEPYSEAHEYELLLLLSDAIAKPHVFREL